MDALRLCGIVLQPMMPQLATRLLDKLNVPGSQRTWSMLSEDFNNNNSNSKKSCQLEGGNPVLFQRIVESSQFSSVSESPQQTKRSKSKKQQKKATSASWSVT